MNIGSALKFAPFHYLLGTSGSLATGSQPTSQPALSSDSRAASTGPIAGGLAGKTAVPSIVLIFAPIATQAGEEFYQHTKICIFMQPVVH